MVHLCLVGVSKKESEYELTEEEIEEEKKRHIQKVIIAVFLIFLMVFGYLIL